LNGILERDHEVACGAGGAVGSMVSHDFNCPITTIRANPLQGRATSAAAAQAAVDAGLEREFESLQCEAPPSRFKYRAAAIAGNTPCLRPDDATLRPSAASVSAMTGALDLDNDCRNIPALTWNDFGIR